MKINRNEKWAMVDDYYLISNLGRWFSLKTLKIIKQNKNNCGYLRINMPASKPLLGRTHYFTHIKVVEMFGDCKGNHIPPGAKTLTELGLSIDHIDGNKSNNKQSNLELVSHSENCLRKFHKPADNSIVKVQQKDLKELEQFF